jgi:hypothetical protein
MRSTEQVGSCDSVSDLYFCIGLIRISTGMPTVLAGIFVVFLSQCKQMPGCYLNLTPAASIPYPFQFIIKFI